MEVIVALIAGITIGALIGWLISRADAAAALATAEQERGAREALAKETTVLREHLAAAEQARTRAETGLDETTRRIEEERQLWAEAESKLTNTFKTLAADALRASSEDFMNRAKEAFTAEREVAGRDFDSRQKAIDELVRPARESLQKLDVELRRIENERRESQGSLKHQLESLGTQAGKLADALKTPVVRGRWGEVQLRNVVEIAGMSDHCDFQEQETVDSSSGKLRPDMIVRLPGGKNVVIDSKAPLKAYLEALDATDDAARTLKLREHAAQIRKHVDQLSSKQYWDACKPTPEFVILFLPGEMFFSAALQQDTTLMEDAWPKKVIVVSPTTLMAVLRAVAYTWRQEQLAENAQRISDLGQELHERLAVMGEHLDKLGAALTRAVLEFNSTVGSLEGRVLVSAREFTKLGVSSKKKIEIIEPVESAVREVHAPEIAASPSEQLELKESKRA
ncbi:MAG: DNA recombination protein RmuC [Candidatus Binataceae bacterium]